MNHQGAIMSPQSNSHPLLLAWEQYLKDGDRRRLFQIASEWDKEGAFQGLLWLAIGAGDWELAKTLEERGVGPSPAGDYSGDLLAYALQDFGDSPHAIEWLLNHGARIDERGINDWTPLHNACRRGYLGTVRVLVKNGAAVNDQTSVDGGWTPLMEACASGNQEIVEFLLSHGADPQVVNLYEGGTARDIAAKRGHREVAAILDAWPSTHRKKSHR